jgi:sulfatase maturation enzyme AslB (radical SAM superfamily)
MLDRNIQLIHLQLTRNCNLRCSFCGQWGEKGYMKSGSHTELSTDEWLQVIEQAKTYREESGVSPQFILWGGEPLISKSFIPVARKLKEYEFATALITNGILLKEFAGVINNTIDTVYVSLDGPQEIHEKIRGKDGIFTEILAGIAALDKEKVELVNLFTLCEQNYRYAAEFPFFLEKLGFDKVLFQPLIYCSPRQAGEYQTWLESFEQKAETVDAWISTSFGEWIEALPEVINNVKSGKYKIAVELYPYELNENNIKQWFNPTINLKQNDDSCLMPYRHLHINADGKSHFCVDFSDFSLGNIRSNRLQQLFFSETADKFRAEYRKCNTLCGRCPWYYNKSLTIDKGKPHV